MVMHSRYREQHGDSCAGRRSALAWRHSQPDPADKQCFARPVKHHTRQALVQRCVSQEPSALRQAADSIPALAA